VACQSRRAGAEDQDPRCTPLPCVAYGRPLPGLHEVVGTTTKYTGWTVLFKTATSWGSSVALGKTGTSGCGGRGSPRRSRAASGVTTPGHTTGPDGVALVVRRLPPRVLEEQRRHGGHAGWLMEAHARPGDQTTATSWRAFGGTGPDRGAVVLEAVSRNPVTAKPGRPRRGRRCPEHGGEEGPSGSESGRRMTAKERVKAKPPTTCENVTQHPVPRNCQAVPGNCHHVHRN
jgi:hypothetical protein